MTGGGGGDLGGEEEAAKQASGLVKQQNSFIDPSSGREYVVDKETGVSSWVKDSD